jgi:hypothetical protein
MSDQTRYEDKQGNSVTQVELFKGKTPDQVKALKFLLSIPNEKGCFSNTYLTEAAYDSIRLAKRGRGDLKDKALEKLGIDETQVQEIEPICFEGYRYEYSKLQPYIRAVEAVNYSSMYEVTWLFFGDEQVYLYKYSFDTTDETRADMTLEYFYKDITAFSTTSDNVQKKVWTIKKSGCSGTTRQSESRNFNEELFRIVVPGEVFTCAYSQRDDAAGKVAAMKQKLREKKQK